MYISFEEVMSYKKHIMLLDELLDGKKAEIKQLKADAKHDADVCYDVDDKHIKIIEGLKAELKTCERSLIKMRVNSSTSHTIQSEIAEYMSMNDKCNGARLFIIPMEEFDEDECCHKWFTWDEGIE